MVEVTKELFFQSLELAIEEFELKKVFQTLTELLSTHFSEACAFERLPKKVKARLGKGIGTCDIDSYIIVAATVGDSSSKNFTTLV
jgi:hypothetical protein